MRHMTYQDKPMGGSDRKNLPCGNHKVEITQVYPDGNLELTGAKGTVTLPKHRVKQVYHNALGGKSTAGQRNQFADSLALGAKLAIKIAKQVSAKDGNSYDNVVEAKLE